MSSISRLNISNTLYEISPSPDGILDNTKYVSNDKSNTTEYINVDPITTTETNSSIFSKITTMIRNIRYIWSKVLDLITRVGTLESVQGGMTEEQFKAYLLDFAYPIGTIYESTNDVSPSTFLGGTWEEYESIEYVKYTITNQSEIGEGTDVLKYTIVNQSSIDSDSTLRYTITNQSQDVEHSYVEQNPQPARLKSIAAFNLGNSLDSGFTVYRWIRVA